MMMMSTVAFETRIGDDRRAAIPEEARVGGTSADAGGGAGASVVELSGAVAIAVTSRTVAGRRLRASARSDHANSERDTENDSSAHAKSSSK
jgi:hypothetical protein